jgi:hypothetical protein
MGSFVFIEIFSLKVFKVGASVHSHVAPGIPAIEAERRACKTLVYVIHVL